MSQVFHANQVVRFTKPGHPRDGQVAIVESKNHEKDKDVKVRFDDGASDVEAVDAKSLKRLS